jgi:hypothetical protein
LVKLPLAGVDTPVTVAVTEKVPAVVEAVTVVCACPLAPVVAVPGLTVSPPPEKLTLTPGRGFPTESLTTTTNGEANVVATVAD